MIIYENKILDGNSFIYCYSDQHKKIRKIGTNEIYDEAYDLLECDYKYEETDIEIEEQ